MKKRFVKKLFVLAVVSTLSLSACGSEVLEEIAPSDVVEQVEDVVSEVAEVVENTTKEEEPTTEETEELTGTTETQEVAAEETEDTTEEETTEVKEEQSVSEEKPVAEVTQKEDKPSTKPNTEKPKEETPKAEEKPVEQKPTQTPATTPVETPSTPVAETPAPTPAPEPSRGTECSSSSDGYHLAVHKTEKQNCEHGDLNYDVCAYCGTVYNKVETGTGTGHDFQEHNASGRPVDCKHPTWVDVYCNNCGAKDPNHPSYHSEVPHNYEVEYVKEADCTEDGWIGYKCTGCGKQYGEKTDDALGHDVQTWYNEAWDETVTCCIHKGCTYGKVKVDGYHLNE